MIILGFGLRRTFTLDMSVAISPNLRIEKLKLKEVADTLLLKGVVELEGE